MVEITKTTGEKFTQIYAGDVWKTIKKAMLFIER
ncbi:cell wall hydrolase (endolysin) [Clostridioides difficile]|uniref:Cell wall hydrolase (Endolysin) n=1 Tax=Clostridioides difficile TaxID=1496 RepID=A0AB74QE13_CLODI|nr:hypothetical protein BER45_001804 [Clostridioides difficile]SJN72093.1 Uncharacterised protein [Clostridioides difficile]SJO64510.1 Uncharacterised protein [Clostridioides difficile]SJO94701.1 Uncharacterised protein [Clostridioides difficile]SJP32413.1 Uncharacterised protein [Clostridioides difficile]